MKKIIALFIPLIMVMTTALTAHAFDPLPPEQQVVYNFKQYYKQQTGYQDLAEIRCVPMENCPGSTFGNEYYFIQFTSNPWMEAMVFQLIGADKEFYERNNVTNLLFPSGMAVFVGNPYDDAVKNDFHPLSWVAENNPAAMDYITEMCGIEHVGRAGDVNGDCKVNIDDVTELQRLLAGLKLFDERQWAVSDIDRNGVRNINDATMLQRILAA